MHVEQAHLHAQVIHDIDENSGCLDGAAVDEDDDDDDIKSFFLVRIGIGPKSLITYIYI